jgi:hypothetical protein
MKDVMVWLVEGEDLYSEERLVQRRECRANEMI